MCNNSPTWHKVSLPKSNIVILFSLPLLCGGRASSMDGLLSRFKVCVCSALEAVCVFLYLLHCVFYVYHIHYMCTLCVHLSAS